MPRLARGTVTRRKRSGARGVYPGWWIRGTTLDGRRTWIRAGDSAAEAETTLARFLDQGPTGGPQTPPAPETPTPGPSSPPLGLPSSGPPSPPADSAASISTPRPSASPTLNDLLAAYLSFAAGYYAKEGQPTKQLDTVRTAVKVAGALFGSEPVSAFGPKTLKACREEFVRRGQARLTANANTARIKRMFRWGTEEELVPPGITHGLWAVRGLQFGHTLAPEGKGVLPVPMETVEKTLPFLPRRVAAMVRTQHLAGMRPAEVCIMRGRDIDCSGRLWEYRPFTHKNAYRGQERIIYLGGQAQLVLAPFVRVHRWDWLFSPRESERERNEARVTGKWNHLKRRAPGRKRAWRDRYDVQSYRQAIHRACERAGVPKWNPNQLRHAAATRIRKEYGLDTIGTAVAVFLLFPFAGYGLGWGFVMFWRGGPKYAPYPTGLRRCPS